MRPTSFKDILPTNAVPISNQDSDFSEWIEFIPTREPGPQLSTDQNSDQTDYSPLGLLRLFLTDDVLDHFIEATIAYAEKQKNTKRISYLRFRKAPLDREEMLRYIGVYLLLSLNSVRSYRKAWNKKSSQVCQLNSVIMTCML